MRVLILSCNTGEGHNSCSKAIQKSFSNRNIDCVLEDALRFVSPAFSKIMSWGHAQMYRHTPGLFRSGYQYAEIHTDLFHEQTGIYRMLTSGTEKLYLFIQEQYFDVIICTHVFSALMITDVMRKYQLQVKTGFVATDYTCSPSCGDSELDVYFIPDSTLKDEFVSCGVPKDKLFVSGIPIRQEFLCSTEKSNAKETLGIPSNNRHLLVMSGSMGCGPIKELLKKFQLQLPDNCHISVVCGTNERLRKKLEHEHKDHPRVHMYGYRKDIPMLMDSADLYLTKPGGISTSEAAAKRLPMVFVNAVAGCETHNMNFFVQRGAAVTADTLEELAALTLSLLTNNNKLKQMSLSFGHSDSVAAADIICDYFIQEILKE